MTPNTVWKSLFGEPRKHRLIHFLIFIDAFGLPVAWHKNWVHFVFTPILVTSLPFKVPMLFDWQKFRFPAKRIFLSNVAFVGNINQWKKNKQKVLEHKKRKHAGLFYSVIYNRSKCTQVEHLSFNSVQKGQNNERTDLYFFVSYFLYFVTNVYLLVPRIIQQHLFSDLQPCEGSRLITD